MRAIQSLFVGLMVLVTTASSQEKTVERSDASGGSVAASSKRSVPGNTDIDYPGFVRLAKDLLQHRQHQRVPIAQFNEMARDPETIVLDTRSKKAFDWIHIANAIHLNFSDFSETTLRSVIPNKTTRILIYCNNNLKQPLPKMKRSGVADASRQRTEDTNGDGVIDEYDEMQASEPEEVLQGVTLKSPALALNIPTFINLHGYGYKNVFELADQLELDDPRLNLVGTEINRRRSSE